MKKEKNKSLSIKKKKKNIRNENGLISYENHERLINLKNRGINDELVRRHFQVQDLEALLEKLRKVKK